MFLDAVHYAPHCLIDVQALGCDFLACSAYKFFGPHVGVLWGRRSCSKSSTPTKSAPRRSTPPDKWMTGTQSHEAIAGALAAVEYLADLGRTLAGSDSLPRRAALREAYREIGLYERGLRRAAAGRPRSDAGDQGLGHQRAGADRRARRHRQLHARPLHRRRRWPSSSAAPASSPGTATTTP